MLAATLVGLFLALPVALLMLALWLVRGSVFVLFRFFSRTPTPWHDVVEFCAAVGWRPKGRVDAYCPGEGVFHATTGASGWRGIASSEVCDVLVFGDSFAFGYGVDDKRMFSWGDQPRVKAVGAPGYNMVQELLLLREYADALTGKLVVWLIFLGNDLYENLQPNMMRYRTPFVRERAGDGPNGWEIVTSHLRNAGWPYNFEQHAKIYRTRLAEICTACPQSERAFAACAFLLAEGQKLCRDAEAQLAVVTVPERLQLSRKGRAMLRSLSPAPQAFSADFPDRQIARICGKLNLTFVAGAEHLTLRDYLRFDPHWNERGHKRMRELLCSLYREFVEAAQLTPGLPQVRDELRPAADPERAASVPG